MKKINVQRMIYLSLAAALLTVLTWLLAAPIAAKPSARSEVNLAWQRAQTIGAYHYTTEIVQTTRPLPKLANVGLSSQTERMYIEGETDLPAETLQMKLWSRDGHVNSGQGSIQLRVADGKAYGRTSDQAAWQEVDDFSALVAPGRDNLGYLAAARNVVSLGSENRAGIDFTRYSFELNGLAFAHFVRAQLEDEMAARGELPPGVSLDLPQHYVQMTGQGEIWLDSEGLPLRQIIDVTFPPDEFEQVAAEITTTFSAWGDSATLLAWNSAGLSVLGLKASRALTFLQRHDWPQTGISFLILVSVAVLMTWLVLHSRSKRIYAAVAISQICLLVGGPLLQTHHLHAFYETQNSRQATYETQREQEQAARDVQAKLVQPDFDPRLSPLAQTQTEGQEQNTAVENTPADDLDNRGLRPQQATTADDDGTDTDGDGLTDALENDPELALGTDPNNPDTDGDGLSDGVEIYELGILPTDPDSDGDLISDRAEVMGFSDNSGHWYLNPAEADTNGDGQLDGLECVALQDIEIQEDGTSVVVASSGSACEDTDSDGTPDVFDLDNDGDGVPDQVDLAPTVVAGNPAAGLADQQFNFQVDKLQAERPVYVDFQLRPVNPDHLWYAFNVLDWPSGDREGQVQRVRDTTFSDIYQNDPNYDPARSPKDANGDLRLTPMLEIEIPFQDGHYGNLPVLAGAPAITPDTPIEDWLDTSQMEMFNISVRKKDDAGTLLVYTPLVLEREQADNTPVAFSARMFYRPSTGDWGSVQQARLVWMVEAIINTCQPSEGEDYAAYCAVETNWKEEVTVIHAYYEDWYLTGLAVREDHGLKASVVLEDPDFVKNETDDNGDLIYDPNTYYERFMWHLADGLELTLLAGRTDASGKRDLAIDDIKTRFDRDSNQNVSDEERWEIPKDALQVETFNFAHQGLIATLPMTHTPQILADHFVDGSGNAKIEAPTLLIVREEAFRSLSLDEESALSGNTLTLTLDAESVPETVLAAMQWAPYRYLGAGAWESYPIDEYWTYLESRLTALLDQDYADEALEGAVLVAQSAYLTRFNGTNAIIELDAEAMSSSNHLSDAELQAIGKSSVGFGKLARTVVKTIVDSVDADGRHFSNFITKLYGAKLGKEIIDEQNDFLRLMAGKGDKGFIDSLKEKAKLFLKEKLKSTSGIKLLATLVLIAVAIIVIVIAVLVAAGIAGTVLFYASNAIKIITSIKAIVESISKISIVVAKGAASGISALNAVKNAVTTITRASVIIAVVGLIITAAVAIGFFIYAVVSQGISVTSPAFTQALAGLIASLIVAVILTAIGLIPIVGQIIVAIIGLIDGVIALVCRLTGADESEDEIVRDYVCAGITGLLTKLVQFLIYDQTPLVDLQNENRLNLTNFNLNPVDPHKGIVVNNQLTLTADVTSTLYSAGPDSLLSLIYFWQFSDQNVKASTFAYQFALNEENIGDSLKRDQMTNQWIAVSDGDGDFAQRFAVEINTDPLPEVGINQPITPLYLTEGYAINTQECFVVPNIFPPWQPPVIPICYLRALKDTTHQDIGEKFKLDIFPARLDDFYTLQFVDVDNGSDGYALAWDQSDGLTFPPLQDADGDGLRNQAVGGNDPKDNIADFDGDGLSDFFEILNGSDPREADLDNDSLNDYQEWLHQTDPYRADTDNDGLLDGEEVFHQDPATGAWVGGWEVVYAFDANDAPLRTLVTANPLLPDTDGDGYLDSLERVYGFHPRVPSDANILTISSQIDDKDGLVKPGDTIQYTADIENKLRDRYAYGLFDVEFPVAVQDETLDPQPYELAAGESTTIAGSVTVRSDLAQSQAISLSNTAGAIIANPFAEAEGRTLWLHLDENAGATTFSDASGSGNNGTCSGSSCPAAGEAGYFDQALRFDGSDDYVVADSVNSDLTSSALSFGGWVKPDSDQNNRGTVLGFHTAGGGNRNLIFYNYNNSQGFHYYDDDLQWVGSNTVFDPEQWHHVMVVIDENDNGTLYINGVAEATFITAVRPAVDGQFSIGQEWDGSSPSDFFKGLIDEVEIYPRALSEEEIVRSASDLVFYFGFDEPISEEAPVTDQSAFGHPIRCDDPERNSNCPVDEEPGIVDKSYRFLDGHFLSLEVPAHGVLDLSRGNGHFSIATWVYFDRGFGLDLPEEGGIVIGNDLDNSNRYPLLGVHNPVGDTPAVWLEFENNNIQCQLQISGLPVTFNHWHHVAATFDGQWVKFYADGQEFFTSDRCAGQRPPSIDQFFIGSRVYRVTNNFDVFYGSLDELRIYNYSLAADEVERLHRESARTLEMRFDERPGATTFADHSINKDIHTGICHGDACPVTGIAGRANQTARFDGSNDYVSANEVVQGLTGSALSFGGWVKPDSDQNNRGTVLGFHTAGGGNRNLIFYNYNNSQGFHYYDDDLQWVGSNTVFDPEQWYHVMAVIDQDDEPDNPEHHNGALYVNGLVEATFKTSVLPATDGQFSIGQEWDGSSPSDFFKGFIDQVTIFNDALTQSEVQALMAEVPVVNLHLNEGLNAQTFSNAADPNLNGSCSGNTCPGTDVKGQIYRAAHFDGEDDLIEIPDNNALDLDVFSVGLWVKPTQQKSDWQPLLTKESDAAGDRNYGLFIRPNEMRVRSTMMQSDCSTRSTLDSSGALIENQWNHVMMTYDGATQALYINGTLDSDLAISTTPCQNSHPVRIGNESAFTPFAGTVDEVVIYGKPLGARDIKELYDYQLSWFDTRVAHDIVVDAEAPTVSLDFSASYIPNTDRILAASAHDPTSSVALVEYRVNGGAWQAATPDRETWLFTFTPSGEGTYTLDVQATDRVGHVSGTDSVTFIVDGTGPSVTLDASLTSAPLLPIQRNTLADTWDRDLFGTLSDTASGVADLHVTVLDAAGVPVNTAQRASLSNGTWQVTYPFELPPNGQYTVRLEATDQVGNVTSQTSNALQIDGTAPVVTMAATEPSTTTITTTATLQGDVDDLANGATLSSDVAAVEIAFRQVGGSAFHNEAMPADTVLYLPFDESSLTSEADQTSTDQFVDISGLGHEVTCAGNSCPSAGAEGRHSSALRFDGTDDYVSANEVVEGLTDSALSFGAWVKPDSNQNYRGTVLGFHTASGSNRNLIFYNYNNSQGFHYYDDDLQWVGSNTVFDPELWYHVMVVIEEYDASGPDNGTLYVNGLAEATFKTSVLPVTDGQFSIGQEWDGSSPSDFLAGVIDDAVVINRALSAAEIEALYLDSGPVLHLPFDEAPATDNSVVTDASGFDQDGVLHTADAEKHLASGQVGSDALMFDGVDDYVEIADSDLIDFETDQDFTVAVWVKADSTQPDTGHGDNDLLEKWSGSGGYPYVIRYLNQTHSNNGKIIAARYDGSNNPGLVSSVPINDNQFHQIAFVKEGSTLSLYLDGVLDGTRTDTTTGSTTNDSPLFLGQRGSEINRFKGELDEVLIYPRALSTDEIRVLYQAGWQEVTLAAGGAEATTWSYPPPGGLEGFYQIDLRARDTLGNISPPALNQWTGQIDTLAPRVSLTGEQSGAGSTAQTHYALTAQDFGLLEPDYDVLCGSTTPSLNQEYFTAPWLLSLLAGQGQSLYQVDASCAKTGSPPVDLFTVCDVSGNCTSKQIDFILTPIAALDTPGTARDVYVAGNYAYIADSSEGGLQIADVTDPTSPALVGSVDTPGDAFRVHVAGNYAYIGDVEDGLQIVNISDPAAPQLVATVDTPGTALGGFVAGSYVYVVDSGSGLQVVDISNPEAPQLVAGLDTTGNAFDVDVSGSYAYIADYGAGLHIVDIANPSDPLSVASAATSGRAFDVFVTGDYAYVANPEVGLQVINIANPTAPQVIASVDTPGSVYSVFVAGSYAYLADTYEGLHVVDISDPATPQIVASADTPGFAYGVFVADDYVYVADDFEGLQIFKVEIVFSEATAVSSQSEYEVPANALAYAGSDAGLLQLLAATTIADERPQSRPALNSQVAPAADVVIFSPTDGQALAAGTPFSIEGGANAPGFLKTLTIKADGLPVSTQNWASGSLTDTLWSAPWTPSSADGQTVAIEAVLEAWDGAIASDTANVIIDAQAPSLSIATAVITSAGYTPLGQLSFSGEVADTVGVAQVEVQLADGSGQWVPAIVNGNTWRANWRLPTNPPPDGQSYTLLARATDLAGQITEISQPLIVDVVPPTPVDLTLSYLNSQNQPIPLTPGETLSNVTAPALTLAWTASSDGSGLPGYTVNWTVQLTDTAQSVRRIETAGLSDSFSAGEAQKLNVELARTDLHGNQSWQTFGAIYVDSPLTPDYVAMNEAGGPYRGWLNDSCSLIGRDTRIADQTQELASLHEVQQFYTTWNQDGLRLTWTGADWDIDGDLFIYFDTQAGGSDEVYNPYPDTADDTVILLPVQRPEPLAGGTGLPSLDRMAADLLIWVQDSQTAQLLQWVDGQGWQTLDTDWDYAFDRNMALAHSDFFLPFQALGIADPGAASLSMVALASEEEALRLWATMPADNLVNSSRVTQQSGPSEIHLFTLTQRYHWSSLGDGICPSQGAPGDAVQFSGASVQASLDADTAGLSYGVMKDNLFFAMPNLFPDLADWSGPQAALCDTHPEAPACQREPTDICAVNPEIPACQAGGISGGMINPPALGQLLIPDFNAQIELAALQDVSYAAVGNNQTINYNLHLNNQGTSPATGLVVDITSAGPLRLPAGELISDDNGDYYRQLLFLGDLAVGAEETLTFQGVIDLSLGSSDNADRAVVEVIIYDERGSRFNNQIDWLHLENTVDHTPPAPPVIQAPQGLIGLGQNTVSGFVVDQSPVPTLQVEVRPPSGQNTTTTCQDDIPDDGNWSCPFEISQANDGDEFAIRLNATDSHGQTSEWSAWYPLTVDAAPPSLTLGIGSAANVADGFITSNETGLSGQIFDNRQVSGVEVCDTSSGSEVCRRGEVIQTPRQTSFRYDDLPASPVAIDAGTTCTSGSELVRTFEIGDSFSVAEVNLGLTIDHPFRNDLVATLIAPSGAEVTLLLAGSAAKNLDVLFTDVSPRSVVEDQTDHNPIAPHYQQRRRPVEALSVFNGTEAQGTWQLRLCDAQPEADHGLYQRSQLVLNANTLPEEAAGTWRYRLPTDQDEADQDQSLTIYALDSQGNRASEPLSLDFTVDTDAPEINVTSVSTQHFTILDDLHFQGTVSDANGIRQMALTIRTPNGQTVIDPIAVNGANWDYTDTRLFATAGDYTFWVVAEDEAGNEQTAGPFTITVTQPELASFVVLGREGVWLRQNSTVVNGNIGVNRASAGPFLSDNVEVSIAQNIEFLDPTTRLLGDSLRIKQNTDVYDVYYNDLDDNGQVLGQHFSPINLPLTPNFPIVPNFTPGTEAVAVAKNKTITLAAGQYATLTVEQKATVIFSGGRYTFQDWNVSQNVNLLFQAPTEIYIADKLAVDQNSYLGPDPAATDLSAADIVFFVTGQNGDDGNLDETPKAAKFGQKMTVIATVYVPNGTLWLRQSIVAAGRFLGKWVQVGQKANLALSETSATRTLATQVAPVEYTSILYLPLATNGSLQPEAETPVPVLQHRLYLPLAFK